MGRDLVGEIDDGDLRRQRPDDRPDDADELVGVPVIGQEGDRVERARGQPVLTPLR